MSIQLEADFSELIKIPVDQLSEQHFHALSEIIFGLNKNILSVLVGEWSSSQVDPTRTDVRHMNDDGLGKVRYCGAWAVAKIKNLCKMYFNTNIRSTNVSVRMKAKEAYVKAELLLQLVWSSSFAQEHSVA